MIARNMKVRSDDGAGTLLIELEKMVRLSCLPSRLE